MSVAGKKKRDKTTAEVSTAMVSSIPTTYFRIWYGPHARRCGLFSFVNIYVDVKSF